MSRARYSPSRLAMLAKCPLFLSGPPGPQAERGTKTHKIIELKILGHTVDVPPELSLLVEFALSVVEKAKERLGGVTCLVFPEEKLDTGFHEVFGTADLVIVDPMTGEAVLIDWKTGFGNRDHPSKNPQVISYGYAAVKKWGLTTLWVWIVELDRETVEECSFEKDDLVATAEALIPAIIEKVKSATWSDASTGSHCKYCVKAVSCPAFEAKVAAPIVDATTVLSQPAVEPKELAKSLSLEEVSLFLDKFWEVRDRFNEVFQQVEGRAVAAIKSGETVSGFRVVEKRGNRRWADEAEAEARLVGEFGEAVVEKKLKSPAQVEKTVKGSKNVVQSLVATSTISSLEREEKRV